MAQGDRYSGRLLADCARTAEEGCQQVDRVDEWERQREHFAGATRADGVCVETHALRRSDEELSRRGDDVGLVRVLHEVVEAAEVVAPAHIDEVPLRVEALRVL
eukprot:scaffold102713_cov32-Tisochrysis_lutea.AAC.3